MLASSLGTTLDMWDGLLPRLGADFRVVRCDQRGHGRSPVPPGPYSIADLGADLVDLLDRLGIERASLCGVSLGGMVAMWLAINAPERLERLVLCCTSAHMPPREQWTERAATVRDRGMEAVADASLERWLTPGAPPELRQRLRSALLSLEPEGYAACCEAIADHDLRAELAAIRAPTLVIATRDDPSTPPDHARAIVHSVDGARLAVLDEGRHLVAAERPAEVARLMLEHLADAERPDVPGTGRTPGHSAIEGMRVRREVLGDEHVDRAVERTSDLTADFQDLITRYAWGEIWTRPGLDRRTRSAITITALIARGHFEELAMHLRAALRNDLTEDELKEVLLQSAIYCGVPAANQAFAVAQRVLEGERAR